MQCLPDRVLTAAACREKPLSSILCLKEGVIETAFYLQPSLAAGRNMKPSASALCCPHARASMQQLQPERSDDKVACKPRLPYHAVCNVQVAFDQTIPVRTGELACKAASMVELQRFQTMHRDCKGISQQKECCPQHESAQSNAKVIVK